mgnify:CR=1 FL=1
MQKFNIAILSYRSARFGGGQGVYVRDISYVLNLMGHNVDVISGPPYPDLHKEINLIRLPGLDLFETFSFKDRLKKFLNKKNKNIYDYYEFFSVLLGGFPEPKTFGVRANKFLEGTEKYDLIIDNQSISYGMLEIQKRFPFIEIIHHPITIDYKYDLESSKSIKYRLSRHRWYSFLKMQKKVAPCIKRIITPSISSKNGIINEFKCKQENISVINNGLDPTEFSPINNFPRKKFRLITTASADVPIKGLDYSLKALKILKKDFPKIHLIVVGNIKNNGHTQRLIKELKLEKDVIFKSNLSRYQIRELYASSSVAIVSSLYEGFGYPVIEAMSCEIPLIATNISSIPELTSNYAKLIEPKNVEMISNSVKEIILDYPKYKEIARNGRQHIIQKFNWGKISEEYEKIILNTVEKFNNAYF